ncbi:hypothetical protein [Lysobacter antibioticus]|uniref:hypothetical protein n=1 Tax=Lysobacter antibioticus TaxID=84531 RepID=UPI0007E8C9A5|nr:hypothetical protein [Lysobacter antibioticus]
MNPVPGPRDGGRADAGAAFALARAVSIALHPFAVFLALTVLGVRALAPQAFAAAMAAVGAAVAVVWLFVWQRHRSGRWSTVDASHPSERPVLYLLLLWVLALVWWWMRGRAAVLGHGIVAVAAMLVAAALLNRWIKLSLHMASLSFAGVALWPLAPTAAAIGLASLPLLGWARLRMRRHRLAEVIGGAALGAGFALGLRWLA